MNQAQQLDVFNKLVNAGFVFYNDFRKRDSLNRHNTLCALALICAGLVPVGDLSGSQPDPNLQRFEISAPMFALLRKTTPDISVMAIDDYFAKVQASNKAFTLEQIVDCGDQFGVRLMSVEIDVQDLSSIPAPSVLLWKGSRNGRVTRIAVLVERVTSEGLLAYDFSEGKGWVMIPPEKLATYSQTIVVTFRSLYRPVLSMRAICVAAIAATIVLIGIVILRNGRSRWRRSEAATVFLLMTMLSGCGTNQREESAFLSFPKSSYDLGLIGEGKQRIEVPITVASKSGVVISKIGTSCGCLKPINFKEFDEFHASHDQLVISFELDSRTQAGDYQRHIQFMGHDGNNNVHTALVSVNYSVHSKPRAMPDRLSFLSYYGAPQAKAEFIISCIQPTKNPRIDIDLLRSSCGPVEIEIANSEFRTFGDDNETRDGRFYLKATYSPEAGSGTPVESIQIAFANCDDKLDMPIDVRWEHPVQIPQNHVFLGFMAAASKVERELVVENRATAALEIEHIRAANNGRLVIEQRLTELVPGENRLEFVVDPGTEPGRQQETLEIDYVRADIPSQSINVSWINGSENK